MPEPTAQPAVSPPVTSLDQPQWYLNRELTWLAFNRRGLHEGQDDRVPLLERVFFLAVHAGNKAGASKAADAVVTNAKQIAKAVADQQFANVMVNQNGLMIGNGEVWISGVCEDTECKNSRVLITAIQNGPQ